MLAKGPRGRVGCEYCATGGRCWGTADAPGGTLEAGIFCMAAAAALKLPPGFTVVCSPMNEDTAM